MHHFERMAKSSRNYIAHEYLNADWHIPSFRFEMIRSLEEAKVTFVGSARLLNRIDGLHLTEEGAEAAGDHRASGLPRDDPGLPGEPALPLRRIRQSAPG